MLQNVANVVKCCRLLLNVLNGFTLFQIVQKCWKGFENVAKHQENITNCWKMVPNVAKYCK